MNVIFSGENLFEKSQLAFVVNHTTDEILVNKSGHATVIRYREFYKPGDTLSGGWIFLNTEKLILHSGSLGKVKPIYHQKVIRALETALGFTFRYIKE